MTHLIDKFNFIIRIFNIIFFIPNTYFYIFLNIYFQSNILLRRLFMTCFTVFSIKNRWNTSTWNFLSCKSNLSYFISKRTFSFVIHEYFCLLKILQNGTCFIKYLIFLKRFYEYV